MGTPVYFAGANGALLALLDRGRPLHMGANLWRRKVGHSDFVAYVFNLSSALSIAG